MLYIYKHLPLIEACRRGEQKAQYEIYRLYSKSMYNVAVRIMNYDGEAEDILQDAFLDAFQKINDFRQTSTLGAWLKQIVITRALNQLRNRNNQWVDIEGGYKVYDEESYDEDSIIMMFSEFNMPFSNSPMVSDIIKTNYAGVKFIENN